MLRNNDIKNIKDLNNVRIESNVRLAISVKVDNSFNYYLLVDGQVNYLELAEVEIIEDFLQEYAEKILNFRKSFF